MFLKHFTIITFIQVAIRLANGTPLAYSRAYNQQKFATPNDINDLEEDHVKRALSDVATTIREVQKLLETDPKLPRLTRGEIEELFENVTKEEYEKSMRKGDRDRAKHMRALMLVLPYNTNNNSDLQELYTRPPITRVVNPGTKPQKIQKIVVQPEDVDPYSSGKNATTYKPTLQIRPDTQRPTTFHPKSAKLPKPVAEPQIVSTSTSTTTTTFAPIKPIISHYTADRPPTPFKVQPKIRDNVKDLLATIGLTQELEPSTTPKPELTQELKELLQSFGLLTNEQPPKHVGTIESTQELIQAPTQELIQAPIEEPIQEEFQPIVSSLIRNEQTVVDEFRPIPSQIRSNYRMNSGPELTSYDFQSFKPLPIPENSPVSGDMEEFLKSFGLFDGNTRGKKSMDISVEELTTDFASESPDMLPKPTYVKMEKMPEVSVDFLAPDLMSVLENIGITSVNKNREKSYDRGFVKYNDVLSANNNRRSDENMHDDKMNVNVRKQNQPNENVTMKMKNNQNITDEDFNKLQQLLETIKKLDRLNANLTDEEIESLNLSNFNFSEALLAQQGPEPIDNVEFDITKNEVKRQSEETTDSTNPLRFTLDLAATTEEFNDKGDFLNLTSAATTETTSVATVETTTSPASTSTSTEDPRRSDLEDSFGSLDPVTEEPLPAPRRNGFYFLADWNSFLEVGEDPDKVVVRFDPKVGDPSRFLKVTVP